MTGWLGVNFQKLVDEACQPQVGQGDLTILGGQCAESQLLKFLEQWDIVSMPFRVWEYVSEVVFEKDTPGDKLGNIALLERGRIFGKGGDMMLCRKGISFDWRLIGPPGTQPPHGDYGTQTYWKNHPEATFHQYEEKSLLWGKWNGRQWSEGRVAAAKLNYPAAGERLQLHYKVYSQGGQVQFVWYTGLSEWKEAADD